MFHKGIILGAVGLEQYKGHDRIIMYVSLGDETIEHWETLASTVCKSGPNEGKPFNEVRMAEWGIKSLDSVDADLAGRVLILVDDEYENAEGERVAGKKVRCITNTRVDIA